MSSSAALAVALAVSGCSTLSPRPDDTPLESVGKAILWLPAFLCSDDEEDWEHDAAHLNRVAERRRVNRDLGRPEPFLR